MTDPETPTAERKADQLDPQLKKIEDIQDTRNFPDTQALAPESQREQMEAVTADASDRIDTAIAETQDFAIEGPDTPLSMRAYIPGDDGPYPVVVFYHGGGFVWGSTIHTTTCVGRWPMLPIRSSSRLTTDSHPSTLFRLPSMMRTPLWSGRRRVQGI